MSWYFPSSPFYILNSASSWWTSIPSQNMFTILPLPSLLVPLLWLWSIQGRCNFDEVQQSVRVVSPLTGSNPTKNSGELDHLAVSTAAEQTRSIHQYTRWGRGTPCQSLQCQRAMREDRAAMAPIRIYTWVPRESLALSELDRERLDSAINETVSIVSSLLSGLWFTIFEC